MTHASPFSWLQSALQSVPLPFNPPAWLVEEGQHRLVLLLNHVLMQEHEAQVRLARKKGSVIHVRWGRLLLPLVLTPAGLLDRADTQRSPDLVLSLETQAPWDMARQLLQGQRPPVQIEGDVQLAAELAWLADNLRWDVEEDLSRLIGDPAAHALADGGRRLLVTLRAWLSRAPAPAADTVVDGGMRTGA